MAAPADFRKATELFGDWRWRLSNLYYITDKEGRKTLFEMNWAQEALFNEMHYLNVILKARQLGFTTFVQVFMLDACVFNSNVRAGTIAHTRDDAQVIFRDKVRFPYDNLPEGIRGAVPIVQANASELLLGNNSGIRVGTSLRSGTLQYLHISEYGKMCARFPDKAREVRTGALNTVQSGQIAFVESTAEGQEGHFYELCQEAESVERKGARLTPLDFKFHFFPWWKHPEYSIDPDGVTVPAPMAEYFDKLRQEHGVRLTAGQRAWYVKKAHQQGADMKREFPSTPDEAFEASVEGAYYADQIAKAEEDGRIGSFPPHDGVPVDTYWDIGVGDYNTIWLVQRTPGRRRVVGYYHNSGEGMPHYLRRLHEMQQEHGWSYGTHYLPHDAAVKEWGSGKTRVEQAIEGVDIDGRRFRLKPLRVVPLHKVDDGINAAREVFATCEFDEAACADGLKALKNYRKEWDEERSVWKDQPRHDWASHGADAFRYFAMADKERRASEAPPPTATIRTPTGAKDVRVIADPSRLPSLDQMIKDHKRRTAGKRRGLL